MGVSEEIRRAIEELGFENPMPVQEEVIPYLLGNKNDVIALAQTGTGKTASYGIPVIQKTDASSKQTQAIILSPTRELCLQIADDLNSFAKYIDGLHIAAVYGGTDIGSQIRTLKHGVQIIVATPGRLLDLINRGVAQLENVNNVVLDEADEMLNMGFREDMETILSQIESEHQTALFSATMPQAILDITDQYQQDAELVRVTKKELTIPLVKQYYFVVKSIYKEEVISRLLVTYGFKRSIIFCNTKKMVDDLAENLKARGYQAEGLHGDMTQKQRDFVMGRFKSGNLEILIATDVAARGIDVDDLEAVFNYDVPQDIEYYVHRIGRTGRAGREGMAFTFAYGRDLYRIRDIERVCKTQMTEMKVPKASEIMAIKLDKVLESAVKTAEKTDLEKLTDQIEEKLADYEADPMELLAALVKQQLGDELQDIVVEEPRRRGGLRDRGERYGAKVPGGYGKEGARRGARGGYGKTNARKGGKDGHRGSYGDEGGYRSGRSGYGGEGGYRGGKSSYGGESVRHGRRSGHGNVGEYRGEEQYRAGKSNYRREGERRRSGGDQD